MTGHRSDCDTFGLGHRRVGATGRRDRVRLAHADPHCAYANGRIPRRPVVPAADLKAQTLVERRRDFHVCGPELWSAVRHTVEDFLLREWRSGALLGTTGDEAFFARCDATTMTADDLVNGRLICEVGVAPVRPAEFVLFRIGQWTATRPCLPD